MVISSTAFLKELFQIFLSLYSKHVCHLFLDYSLNDASSDEDERVAFLPKTASPLKKFVLIHGCPGTGTCTLSLSLTLFWMLNDSMTYKNRIFQYLFRKIVITEENNYIVFGCTCQSQGSMSDWLLVCSIRKTIP